MLDDVIGWLACPQCGASLVRAADASRGAGSTLRCPSGHAFDIARQGYVSLLPPGWRAPVGDTAAMVQARADFLAAGHYGGLAAELARAVASVVPGPPAPGVPGAAAGVPGAADVARAADAAGVAGCVVDVGAGTGYYLAAVLDRVPDRAGLALDVSRFALRRAARAHRRIGAVAADARGRLPVADAAAAAVLSVFAPRNGPELRRILGPAGRLVVVTPDAGHLSELVGPLRLLSVDPRKDERLAGKLSGYFDLAAQREYRASVPLGHRDIAAVVAMGPSAWHVEAGVLADRIRGLPGSVPVTVSVTLRIFRPAPVVP